jgi:hypothetical protein
VLLCVGFLEHSSIFKLNHFPHVARKRTLRNGYFTVCVCTHSLQFSAFIFLSVLGAQLLLLGTQNNKMLRKITYESRQLRILLTTLSSLLIMHGLIFCTERHSVVKKIVYN